MTQYNSTVWPALAVPPATNLTGNGGTAEPSPAPPSVLPVAQSVSGDGGFAEPSPTPPIPPSAATVENVSYPAPYSNVSAPVYTTYVPSFQTQQAIYKYFGLQSQTGLAISPHWYFATLGPARVATTAALPAYTVIDPDTLVANANGSFPVVDTISPTQDQFVLVKNEVGALAPNNGLYALSDVGNAGAPWKLVRVAGAPQICVSDVTVLLGAVNAGTFWVFFTDPNTFTLGTTDLVWVQGYENAYSNDPPRTGAPPYWVKYTGNV